MPHVLSLKPVSIRSLSGYAAVIEPSKPTLIPAQILTECLTAGCVECDAEGNVLISGKAFRLTAIDDAPAAAASAAPAAGERDAAIQAAVAALVAEGNTSHFNQLNGLLKVPAVSEKCGFKVSAEEIRQIMESDD